MSSAPAAVSRLVVPVESLTSKASRYFPLTPVRPTSTCIDQVDLRSVGQLKGCPTGAQDHHLRTIFTGVGFFNDQAQLIAIEAHGSVIVVNRYDQTHLTHSGTIARQGRRVPRLAFLDRSDDGVGHRQQDHLHHHLVEIARDGVADQAAPGRKHADEGDEAEQHRVGEFPYHG